MQGLRSRFCALVVQQLRAPLPPAGKKAAKLRGPAKVGQLSGEVVSGLAVRKGAADPPILPDGEYPGWLWGLLDPPPTTAELQRKYEKEGLTLAEMKRLYRYQNKQRIREANAARAKD